MARLTYKESIRETIRAEMLRDERVVLLGEEISDPFGGPFRTLHGLQTQFGKERVRETPISETAIMGTCLGLALAGMRPVADMLMVDFTMTGMDQIVNQIAKFRYMSGGQSTVPLTLRMGCGIRGGHAAQHSQSLEAFFCHVPGLLVVMPSTARDVKGLLTTAIRDDNPVIVMEPKGLLNVPDEVPDGEFTIPLGQAEVKRPGRDVTVVAMGLMVVYALAVAERLAGEGIEVEVVDPRSLVPLDRATIVASVQRTGRVVIAHQANERGGFGAEIAAVLARDAFDYLEAPIERVAARNVPIPYSGPLEAYVAPDQAGLEAAIRRVLR